MNILKWEVEFGFQSSEVRSRVNIHTRILYCIVFRLYRWKSSLEVKDKQKKARK